MAIHEAHRTEDPPGPSHGPAVLEIGAGVGAAVVYTTAALDGAEIEVRRSDGEWDGTHTAIRRRSPRRPGSIPVYAALFDHLPAGQYELRIRGSGPTAPRLAIAVEGATVTESEFPG